MFAVPEGPSEAKIPITVRRIHLIRRPYAKRRGRRETMFDCPLSKTVKILDQRSCSIPSPAVGPRASLCGYGDALWKKHRAGRARVHRGTHGFEFNRPWPEPESLSAFRDPQITMRKCRVFSRKKLEQLVFIVFCRNF